MGTLGYALYGAGAALITARTTAGIAEIGTTGIYVANVQKISTQLFIVWDDGAGSPLYATEDLTTQENNILVRNRRELNQGTGKQTSYQDDDATTYLEGDAFEDQAGATPYAGNGVERTDRLA